MASMKAMLGNTICVKCTNKFMPVTSRQKYCSPKCSSAAYNDENGPRSNYPGIATSTVGAIGELRVAVDLLSKKYEVFRSISSACSCDLAILKNGKLLRIEVRTAYRTKNGTIICDRKDARADHVALVLPNEIIYEPCLPITA
jgi:hypothetical protein